MYMKLSQKERTKWECSFYMWLYTDCLLYGEARLFCPWQTRLINIQEILKRNFINFFFAYVLVKCRVFVYKMILLTLNIGGREFPIWAMNKLWGVKSSQYFFECLFAFLTILFFSHRTREYTKEKKNNGQSETVSVATNFSRNSQESTGDDSTHF